MNELRRPDLLAVLEHYGCDLPRRYGSGWVKVRCPLPWHDDASASASVNLDLGKWICRSACWEERDNGDSLDLIQAHEGIDLAAAVQYAEEHFAGSLNPVRGSTRRKPGGTLFGQSRDRGTNRRGSTPGIRKPFLN